MQHDPRSTKTFHLQEGANRQAEYHTRTKKKHEYFELRRVLQTEHPIHIFIPVPGVPGSTWK